MTTETNLLRYSGIKVSFRRQIKVRWFIVAAVAALSSIGVNASAQDGFDGPPSLMAPPPAISLAATLAATDTEVTVTVIPIPTPAPVIELIKEASRSPAARPVSKAKIAGKKAIPKSMFSRTERQQMQLAAKPRNNDQTTAHLFDDEDAGSGTDDLDLHRFFSRPQVSKVADKDDEDEDPLISETVKLRLFMARMKAVQAHQQKYPS